MNIKKIINKIYKKFILKIFFFNKYLVVNFNKNIGGEKLVTKEIGFLFKFIFNNFFTFHLRPKKSNALNLISYKELSDIGIIIQGPIKNNKNFLINTINIYKKIFSKSKIIISIWEDEDINFLNKLKNLDIELIINKYPQKKGFGNINLQIISTNAALKLLKKLGIEFAIKTRTDCRIYNPKSLNYLKNMYDYFPVKKNENIKGRIIASSLITCKFRIYGLTDILLFSKTDILLNYFNNELFDDSLLSIFNSKHPLIINETPVISEIFLCSRYLIHSNVKIDWTLENWWDSLKDYFCIIDNNSIDMYWNKYDKDYEHRFIFIYSKKTNRIVEFSDWLDLQSTDNIDWHKYNYKEVWGIKNDILYQKKVL